MKKLQDFDGADCEALPEMFFPQGQNMDMLMSEIRIAKAICVQCPIKQECLEYALVADEPYGIWGGLTPTERNILKRRR
jgi:WhiB family redox-sensing transcriptional regulator